MFTLSSASLRMLPTFSSWSNIRAIVTTTISLLACVLFLRDSLSAAKPAPLAGTQALDWPEDDLSTRMMDGLHLYVERKIEASPDERQQYWQRDTSSPAAYEKSIEPNRSRFRQQIGLIDARVAPRLERFSTDGPSTLVGETKSYRAYQVRWDVL